MSRSFGGEIVDHPRADPDLSGRDRLETGDHPQKRRLPAAGRTDQGDELAVGDGDRDVMNDFDIAVRLAHIDNVDRCHSSPPVARRFRRNVGSA